MRWFHAFIRGALGAEMIPFVDTDVCCYVASMLISLFWLWCHMMDMTIKNSILCRACSAAFAGHNMFVAFTFKYAFTPATL